MVGFLLTGLTFALSIAHGANEELLDISGALPSSCNDLPDGVHTMKLIDSDEYPAVNIRCSNQFGMLDYTLDPNIEEYFSSWTQWFPRTVGPTNSEHINWEEWFLPTKTVTNPDGTSTTATSFVISPDCSVCELDHPRQIYSKSTTYWMTGTIFGCFWKIKGAHNCDVDYDTDVCYACIDGVGNSMQFSAIEDDAGDEYIYDYTGICPHNVRESNYWVTTDHDMCTAFSSMTDEHTQLHLKPSLGIEGAHCVCFQQEQTSWYSSDYANSVDVKADKSEQREDDQVPEEEKEGKEEEKEEKDEKEEEKGDEKEEREEERDEERGEEKEGKEEDKEEKEEDKHADDEMEKENDTEKQNSDNVSGVSDVSTVVAEGAAVAGTEGDLDDGDLLDDGLDEEDSDAESIVEHYTIYQSDFSSGTYRITESGYYKVMEDIVFDFNANEESPQADGAWWPTADQADDYPGAGSYKDAYFAGFFAGITIEVDDVVLDLNGHRLEMSDNFYYQQRWFTTIELSTQYFLPGQGFGNFGGDPKMATNVEIKNGLLGLTSHHGIHGNYNKDIKITDVTVENFETHGIQFNGFENIELTNVNVGPTSDKVYFTGEYSHMRMLLPRYRAIADEVELAVENGEMEEEEMYIQFYGRDEPTTMREIATELEYQMNLAFNYVTKGTEFSENDDDFASFANALKLFVNNEHGYMPNAAAQYGIFLNTFGASVFTYNLATNFYSTTATLTNVRIHGMNHNMKEYVRMNEPGSVNIMVNPFVAPVNVEELFEDTSDDGLQAPLYKGNVVIDALIASNKFTSSWDYLGAQVTKTDFLDAWAQGDDSSLILDPAWNYPELGCNSDVMIHSGKGINGLRLDGVEEIVIENIKIYDLYDATPLGKTICGAYEDGRQSTTTAMWGGHFRQTAPMQKGFSGNMNQGININAAQSVTIKNVEIDNIVSETGPAFGISIWPSCDVTLSGDITVSNIQAGTIIEPGTYAYDDFPNQAPEACGVRVWYEWDEITTTFTEQDVTYTIDSDSITGHVGCFGSDSIFDRHSEDQFYELVTTLTDYTSSANSDTTTDVSELKYAAAAKQHKTYSKSLKFDGKNSHNSGKGTTENIFGYEVSFPEFLAILACVLLGSVLCVCGLKFCALNHEFCFSLNGNGYAKIHTQELEA